MKKILFITLFAVISCLDGMAYTWYIIGDEALLGKDWESDDANKMTLFDNTTHRNYLIKRDVEIANDNTTYYFRVWRRNDHQFDYDGELPNTDEARANRKASVTFARAGVYDLVFCFDEGTATSLDVLTCAKVAGSNTPLDWSKDMTQNAMLLEDDNYFHYTTTFTSTGATTVEYKVIAMHRTTAGDNDISSDTQKHWYGTSGYDDGSNVTFSLPAAGTYEVEFLFDPIRKSRPWSEVRQCYDLTIGDAGVASFSTPFDLTVPSGVKAYYFTRVQGSKLPVDMTDIVPATTTTTPQRGTGVILQASPGTYRFYKTDEAVTLTDNILYGTGANSYLDSDNATYVFGIVDEQLGFYKAGGNTTSEKTFAPYKAFLMASDVEGSGARSFLSVDFASVTSIAEVGMSQQTANHTYYNLQGQPVEYPTKGLYIVAGRKMVVK